MSYTKADIPKLIDIFEKAKLFLWNGEGERSQPFKTFLCICLEEVDHDAEFLAKDLVEDAIRPYTTLEGWLQGQGVPYTFYANTKACQVLRLQWLDKIITDLKEYAK